MYIKGCLTFNVLREETLEKTDLKGRGRIRFACATLSVSVSWPLMEE